MTPDEWARVREIFDAARDRLPEERPEFIARACSGQPNVREQVNCLLLAHDRAGGFLDSPAWLSVPAAEDSEPLTTQSKPETAGTVIGRYHLVQEIGAGGMGEVWLAEQKEPVRRRVAIKLVKAGMNTREVMARFESERQALALMDHPAIAKVFDAGSTPQGAPYFVMEYVKGVPITNYCDDHRLSTRERLEIFMHVCEGVQHAHQKAIIHRDLKPSNILVTEVDARPAPKIIDFGIAKALDQRLTKDTIYTRAGTFLGTPEYMSPEQAVSSSGDIDTRTDVYSLGVIFYELLAGAPPLELQKVAYDEFLRRLREEEPPKPSTNIRTRDPVTCIEVARKRQTEPATLVRQLRGDLDLITLKALEKDRARRYGSPSEFAADVGRYLRNAAVLAVPPSVAYRARKFGRRYRAALITVAAFVLVLVAATLISIRQSIRANREAAVAQAVNDFLQNDLLAQASAATQAGPSAKPDPHLEVRTALDRAAARIGGRFAGQPEVEASIRDTMGQTYEDLGLYPEARKQFERALELHRRALGANSPTTLKMMNNLGRIAMRQGKYQEAEALLSQALAIQRRVLGPEHPETLRSMNNLAADYDDEGDYPHAEALQSQVLEFRRRTLGPEHPDTLRSMINLANVYEEEGKYPQAETVYSRTLEISRRVLGPEHPFTLMSMSNLAAAYTDGGKPAQAETLLKQSLEMSRRVLGPEHPDTLRSMNNLAVVYDDEGKYAQGEALYSQALEMSRRVLGPEHPETLVSMNNLADAYSYQGKQVRAKALFSQTLEIARRVLGPAKPYTLIFVSDFGSMYQRQGDYALAETYASQAFAGRRHALGPKDPDTLASEADLALAYVSEARFAESDPLASEALNTEKTVQPDNWQRFRAASLLGATLAGEKKYAEAEPLLLEGYQGMLARKEFIGAPERYHLDLARRWLIQLYQTWGKPDKAAEWSKKCDYKIGAAPQNLYVTR
jgi:eukaryotic-like serine/threonine-protein kinase